MANITYIRIGDKVYGLHDGNALTSDSNLNASKVVGTLPANTYIDTTYENKAAVEGGTDVSLVTTGDKYRWNNASGGGLQNLVDGSSTGSVRGINAAAEDSQYTIGEDAFAEGYLTKASGIYSHAEGSQTKARGRSSHAEGVNTTASGLGSHAEGVNTTAAGSMLDTSHAEGVNTTASGSGSHAEGVNTTASGRNSHAQNNYTIAAKNNQTAIGKYNIEDTETVEANQKAFIIGNGSATNNRSNALTVDWQGNVDIASGASYKINGTPLSASDVGAQPTLESGINIKTINNQSIIGSGNLSINIPTNVSDLTNDSNFQNATQVEAAINTKISSVYKAKGSIAFANLPALAAANEGFVYNIIDDFTTTSDFVEGAGAQYAAGTNVVIIDIGSGVYKYDVLASTVATPLGLVQKNESRYVTSTSSETTIPIGISGFRSTDVLFVDINGLDLVQGTDYTISGSSIVLTTPITTIGTEVHFIAMRMAEVTTEDYAQLKGDPGTIQIVRW